MAAEEDILQTQNILYSLGWDKNIDLRNYCNFVFKGYRHTFPVNSCRVEIYVEQDVWNLTRDWTQPGGVVPFPLGPDWSWVMTAGNVWFQNQYFISCCH